MNAKQILLFVLVAVALFAVAFADGASSGSSGSKTSSGASSGAPSAASSHVIPPEESSEIYPPDDSGLPISGPDYNQGVSGVAIGALCVFWCLIYFVIIAIAYVIVHFACSD